MKKWMRRLGYFLVIVVWALVMLFPIATFTLARKGEFTVQNTRVFLISERTQGGVGFQSTRTTNDDMCMLTSVRYLMWEGEGENIRNCSCSDGVERDPGLFACSEP